MQVSQLIRVAALAICGAMATVANAADISGAGATFPFPIYAKWADAYKKDTGNGLNYQSIGSGAGIKQIKARTVTFGATDAPLAPAELEKAGLAQWPMVMGGIVAVVNLDGVKQGAIVIDGPTLAQIYLGKITTWNDPALKALNPKLDLPNLPIVPIHRADGSGTTFNFTDYLAEVSPDWKSQVGVSTTVDWPGGIGAKGNDGVANNVATTKGAIGYVEYAYAVQNKLTYAAMANKAGKVVTPTTEAFQAAAANADWDHAAGFHLILANQAGDKSWPMTAATFILLPKDPPNKAAAKDAIDFFKWAYQKGDKMAEDLDYIPMPDNVVNLVEAMWAKDVKLN
ncbi:MAG TPA: phosphate ABC transporter substrate-binding protein PstS [Roseiarcus sp.]|jgi:phosphate transport system substrate-binding protein